MSDRIIRHRSLPVEAPECFWRALQWEVYENTDVAGSKAFSNNIDTYLARQLAAGKTGQAALAAAVQAEQDDVQERSRVTAAAREGEAIMELAKAIRSSGEAEIVKRIMNRVSEKTQYALRQQLAGTGLLP